MKALNVTELTLYIKELMERDDVLSAVSVRGELSNYKIHSSGHHYFTLKDEGAVISAVMFKGQALKLRFRPESGMKVILHGRVSLFPKSGQYQIYVSDMQPDGVGALYVAFEQLKKKLLEEGLFKKERKRPLPVYPEKIAVITSPTGAAVRDMIGILGKRWPLAHVLICPVSVQGEGAAQEIAAMIDYVNAHRLADVIITGRGGGSIEDLWSFNEEIVARAIFASGIPVISAVGHEPDITISDYVADVRASTPSNAAEIAVRSAPEVKAAIGAMQAALLTAMVRRITSLRERVRAVSQKSIMQSPYQYLDARRMNLSLLEQRLINGAQKKLQVSRERFFRLGAKLDALSPLKVLSRGYALARKDERPVTSVTMLSEGDRLALSLKDGGAMCQVLSISHSGGK